MSELRTEGLVHVYRDGDVRAIAGVDLLVPAGQRLALIGQNGSGKTTLVRHFNGLLRPTEGRVLVDGRDAAALRVAQLAHLVGLVFQDPDRQIFSSTVRAEVEFGPRNLGLSPAERGAVVDAALTAVEMASEAETNPYDLGQARRKLLAIASVLAMRTPVLVLDEPTTGQDARGIGLVRKAIDAVAAEGRTVVTITHDMRFAAENFDRVVVMRAGRIVLDGPPEAVFGEASWPVLASTYLEPPLAAVVGAKLGFGSTPTADALATALRERPDQSPAMA